MAKTIVGQMLRSASRRHAVMRNRLFKDYWELRRLVLLQKKIGLKALKDHDLRRLMDLIEEFKLYEDKAEFDQLNKDCWTEYDSRPPKAPLPIKVS